MQGVNPASFPTGPFAPTLLHPGPLPGSASEARGGEFYFTASRAAVPTSVFSPGNTERELLGALSARIHKKGPDPARTLTSVHDYWKNHSFDFIWTFVGKVMSLLFNMLSRVAISFFNA